MSRTLIVKELIKTRLASTYGGWIYCEGCGKTIGYLCYVTYGMLRYGYKCRCGNEGSANLAFDDQNLIENSDESLLVIKNRLCCPVDKSPLITILSKNLITYECEITCIACGIRYRDAKK